MGRLHDATLRVALARNLAAFEAAPHDSAQAPLKHAAVAITVCRRVDGEAAFLLTRRAATLRNHSGQWALPGGRCDPGETAVVAALRELDEELGVRVDESSVLGELDDYATRSGYRITPVVVWIDGEPVVRPNAQEVASVHWIALADIEADDAVDFVTIPESPRRVVRLRIDDRFVHAPTAAVLFQFRELLAGRITRIDDLEQPVFAWR